MRIKIIELFSGYGSQSLALENLGIEHEIVAISDIDKYALQAYSQLHNGNCPNLGDITKITELEHCDILTYSFPCTSISGAGKQEGLEEGSGTASSLLWECRRLIQSSKPKYLLMENVKALTSKKFKPYFDKWLDELEGMGYKSYWKVVNAKEYLPQNRERVFCVSIRSDVENDFNFDNVKNTNEMNLKLKDMLEDAVDEKYYLSEEYVQRFLKSDFKMDNEIKILGTTVNPMAKGTNSRHWVHDTSGIIGTIDATTYKQPKQIIQVDSLEAKEFLTNQINKDELIFIGGIGSPNRLKDGKELSRNYKEGYRVYDSEGLAITQKANGGGLGGCTGLYREADVNYRIRKLTPKECLRLMGLRDEQIDKMNGISNSQLYKMAGNSIVIPVLEAIFKELFKDKIK